MNPIQEMKYKAEFEGYQYTGCNWNVTVNDRPRRLTIELQPGYSNDDHLFDLVIAAIDARLREKSAWSTVSALDNGLWRARQGCGCHALMIVKLDGQKMHNRASRWAVPPRYDERIHRQ